MVGEKSISFALVVIAVVVVVFKTESNRKQILEHIRERTNREIQYLNEKQEGKSLLANLQHSLKRLHHQSKQGIPV